MILGAAAVPVIVMAIGIGVLTYPAHQSATIALPPDRANPAQVVRAFVSAVNAHDCTAAQEMAMPAFRSKAESWCSNASSITHLVIGDALPVHSGKADRIQVQVSFDLKWRMFHNDTSLPNGHHTWGFELEATKGTARWRIAGDGDS